TLAEVLARMAPYFENDGQMIDQAYQARLVDGTVRCYMVGDTVAGFGHQAINALYPTSDERAQPGPRLYHPPDAPDFAPIRQRMEQEWTEDLLRCLGLKP